MKQISTSLLLIVSALMLSSCLDKLRNQRFEHDEAPKIIYANKKSSDEKSDADKQKETRSSSKTHKKSQHDRNRHEKERHHTWKHVSINDSSPRHHNEYKKDKYKKASGINYFPKSFNKYATDHNGRLLRSSNGQPILSAEYKKYKGKYKIKEERPDSNGQVRVKFITRSETISIYQ